MARKQNTPLDAARQALKKAGKQSARKAKKLSREFARVRAQALKQAETNQSKELVAQWRALKKYGYIKTTLSPSLKHLTPARAKAIRKAFKQAQSQAGFVGGKVVRPFERQIITTTVETVSKAGRRKTVSSRIKYNLSQNFRLVKSKFKPAQQTGFVKTSKGYMFQALPEEVIKIKPSGVIQRDLRKIGGFLTESRAITGEEILKLGDDIRSGKFKLPSNKYLQVHTFGSPDRTTYDHDTLIFFADRLERYERTMATNVFQAYLDETMIFIKTR